MFRMWLFVLVLHLWLVEAQNSENLRPAIPDACLQADTNRPPEYEDLTVDCNTEFMDLTILLCPIYQSLYDESVMALNQEFGKQACLGQADWEASPPVLRFKVSISLNQTAENFCGTQTTIIGLNGTGLFSDYSNVQYANISGAVYSLDASAGTITYMQQLKYRFSCLYALQYLVNNTKLGVSGVSLAIKDNNGSFISTLSMALYSDNGYTTPLIVPASGLNLKTRIFVGVKATNLTDRFNVLLDRCFATTSPSPSPSDGTFFDLFVGCVKAGQTVLEDNGVSQVAHFSFEAFRFVKHRNQSVSTFFLHCITRLCEVANCPNVIPVCTRQGRSRDAKLGGDSANNQSAVISSPQIVVSSQLSREPAAKAQSTATRSTVVGLSVAMSVSTVLFGVVLLILFKNKNKK